MALFAGVAFGLVALHLMRLTIAVHRRRAPKEPVSTPGFSLLKPLCGVDDDLAVNLEQFADLGYPNYEVLLGVRDTNDAAYPVAVDFVRRYPKVFSLHLQEGDVGLNPKVNQLATLEKYAKHEIMVISDSNTRVAPGYLQELAAMFEDPQIACTSNPVSGAGHRSFASLMDNYHLASAIGSGQIGAKLSVGNDVVIGKSMALRREVVEKLGGFAGLGNYLTEDYVIGVKVRNELGMKIGLATLPVFNIAVNRSMKSFWQRYVRWGVIQRTAVSLGTSLSQVLLNPIPLALIAAVLSPSWMTLGLFVSTVLIKTMVDVSMARALDCGPLGWRVLPATIVKDLIVFVCWANGLVSRTVTWRGNRLTVTTGSRLLLPEAEEDATPVESLAQ